MKYIYILLLCMLFALIVSFRKYKSECFSFLTNKEAPLKVFYGFSMLILTLLSKNAGNKKNTSPDKLSNILKSISYGLCAFIIIIFFGFLYTFTASDNAKPVKNDDKIQASSLSDAQIDTTNSTTASDETESFNKIKDTITIFESHRNEIEQAFLDENKSCLSITKPLKLISEYGEEGILISWSFEPENVIDTDGNIIYENVSSEGCSTLAYARLTLDDVTATLTIPIFISPP